MIGQILLLCSFWIFGPLRKGQNKNKNTISIKISSVSRSFEVEMYDTPIKIELKQLCFTYRCMKTFPIWLILFATL